MRVVNVVMTANLGCDIDLRHVTYARHRIAYNPRRFSAAIWRELKATCLLFRTGRLVLCGATSVTEGRRYIRRYARLIQKLDYTVTLTEVKVQTMTAAHDMGCRIYLERLHPFLGVGSDYSPELYPGLIYKTPDKKSATVFHNGKMILAGGRSVQDLDEFLAELVCAVHFTASDTCTP